MKWNKLKYLGVPLRWTLFLICISPHWPVTKSNETECGRVSGTMQARVHLSPYVNSAGRGEALSQPHSGHFKESAPPDMSQWATDGHAKAGAVFVGSSVGQKAKGYSGLKAAALKKHCRVWGSIQWHIFQCNASISWCSVLKCCCDPV